MSTVLDTCIIVDVASVHMPLCGSSTTVFELHTPSLTSDTNSDTLTPTNKYLVKLMLYSYDLFCFVLISCVNENIFKYLSLVRGCHRCAMGTSTGQNCETCGSGVM